MQIEAGEEVSLPADPSHITVVFGPRVSRPIDVDFINAGVTVSFLNCLLS